VSATRVGLEGISAAVCGDAIIVELKLYQNQEERAVERDAGRLLDMSLIWIPNAC